jgi:hypothetical protein
MIVMTIRLIARTWRRFSRGRVTNPVLINPIRCEQESLDGAVSIFVGQSDIRLGHYNALYMVCIGYSKPHVKLFQSCSSSGKNLGTSAKAKINLGLVWISIIHAGLEAMGCR